jgi:hypothetical protein
MSRVLISLGQMPAKLDAVKYIGNKFQGGLMLKLANELEALGHTIYIVKWKYNNIEIPSTMKVIDVDDILQYYTCIEEVDAEAYILGAAVANLMPVTPWVGKFPSHNYSENQEFDIRFKIAPRIINMVKKKHHRSTLIGFKLSTGSHYDAFETLKESNADLVIYNNPKNLDEVTFCYKTFLCKKGNRSEIAERIDYLLKIGYVKTEKRYFPDTSDSEKIDLHAYFQIKELEKYVLDENRHGAIGICADNGFYVHTRYHKYIAILNDNRYIDNNLEVHMGTDASEKYTEALPMFKAMKELRKKHRYFIHTHKELNVDTPYKLGYIPPNSNVDSLSEVIHDCENKWLEFDDTKLIIKSECHGYFMSFEKLADVLDLVSNRNWVNYDPPTRYINDNSDIFDDVLAKEKFVHNVGLEIGGNSSDASKVFEHLHLKRHVIDPYFDEPLPAEFNRADDSQFDIIVAKNCAPIIGLNSLELYSKIGTRLLFNFPKQYMIDREVDCLHGSIKRELSYHVDGKVFHSLILISGDTTERDVHHTYDMLTEEIIYNRFHKRFEIFFRHTERGVWCYMKKLS